MLGTVALEGLEFFAYHGVSAEERQVGNRFTVDIAVLTDMTGAVQADDLEGTVDYGQLYAIAAEVMGTSAKLLEHLAGQMLVRIFAELPTVREATLSIAKANPPLGGLARCSKITITQTRA